MLQKGGRVMAGVIEGRGLEWMNETVQLSDGTEVEKWILALTYIAVMGNVDKLNGKEKEMAKEYGSLTLEQQGKLMREIDALASMDNYEDAKRDAKELIDFIWMLESVSFITPNNRVKYLEGIQNAMAKRRDRFKEKKA
jgi:hypothetical protein